MIAKALPFFPFVRDPVVAFVLEFARAAGAEVEVGVVHRASRVRALLLIVVRSTGLAFVVLGELAVPLDRRTLLISLVAIVAATRRALPSATTKKRLAFKFFSSLRAL